jgi:hypothetical protein
MPDRMEQSSTRRALRIGALVLVLSLLGMLAPLLIGSGKHVKYLVGPAFVGACVGLCILLNAGIDWMRGK